MYSVLFMPWIYLATLYMKCRRSDTTPRNIPESSWQKNTHALLAASSGQWRDCFQLLDCGADVEYHKKYTMLMHSVFQNNIYAAQRLLEDYNANPNKGSCDLNPLMIAIQNKNVAMVRMLLEHGAHPNKYAPLFFALRDGTYTMVRLLLEHGADPNELIPLPMHLPNRTVCKVPVFYVMACTDRDDLYNLVKEFGMTTSTSNYCGCSFLEFVKAAEAIKLQEKIEQRWMLNI